MAAYHRVDGLKSAITPRSAPSPTLGNEYVTHNSLYGNVGHFCSVFKLEFHGTVLLVACHEDATRETVSCNSSFTEYRLVFSANCRTMILACRADVTSVRLSGTIMDCDHK